MPTCPPCLPISCETEGDFALYDIQDGSVFRNPIFSFFLPCPPGYYCSPGYYPRTIIITPGSLPPIIGTTGNGIPLTIQGCSSVITRMPPDNATDAQIQALVDEMFAEAAAQQAACENLLAPSPGVPPPIYL